MKNELIKLKNMRISYFSTELKVSIFNDRESFCNVKLIFKKFYVDLMREYYKMF